ncbi:MAG: MAPEG family protein, partial [Betaproteobacteria bacterium]
GVENWCAVDYNHHHPRSWRSSKEDCRASANAAQQNSFEAFSLFAGGTLLALVSGTDVSMIAQTCWVFVIARVLYVYCYVTDKATLRSIVWLVGLIAAVRLYLLAI